jgi:outer membrane immunogenic protein
VTIAMAAATAVGASHAADMPVRPYTVPAPVRAYSWTGPYLGGTLGYLWSHASPGPGKPSGVAGSIQGGYNWQLGSVVYGVETDMSLSAADDRFASWKFSNPWFGTTRARFGFVLDRVLLYGTLGFAYGGGEIGFTGSVDRNTHVGWTAGGGVEIGLTTNWSAKVEYLFVDLADRSYPLTGARQGFDLSVLRLGVNYRF